MKDLEGDVAVVTGAGRGFGRAVAQHLGRAGATVCLIARGRDEVDAVAGEIGAEGGTAAPFALDVTDRSAVDRCFAGIAGDLGPVSVLVNNAGTLTAFGPLWESDADVWWRDVEIHLRGTLLCSHAALKAMVPRRAGRIINVGGMLGQHGEPYSTAYTCAKAAIYRLTECLAAEVADHRISVFCMSPGPVRTRLTGELTDTDEGRRWLPEFADLHVDDWVSPDVGAALVHRLARGDADALSGKALHVSMDLDELLAEAGAVAAGDRLSLRIRQ